MAVYIDTGAWIALLDRKDSYHQAASAVRARIQKTQETLITGWHTLFELADGLTRHTSQNHAAQTIRRILESPSVRVEASEPHLDRALEIVSTHGDWNVDLSDCISFALMEAHGIQRAFAYDRDFEKAGFEVLG